MKGMCSLPVVEPGNSFNAHAQSFLSPDLYTFDRTPESSLETYHQVCKAYEHLLLNQLQLPALKGNVLLQMVYWQTAWMDLCGHQHTSSTFKAHCTPSVTGTFVKFRVCLREVTCFAILRL